MDLFDLIVILCSNLDETAQDELLDIIQENLDKVE